MSASLTITLKRASKVYHEGETIAGVVVVDTTADLRHEGLTLSMEGSVNLQLSTKNTGIFDAFSNNIRPINLINTTIELAAAGKIPVGVTEIPFELPLTPRPHGPALLETYHGVFVNVLYTLKCGMKRSFLNKPLHTSCQFFVQYRPHVTDVYVCSKSARPPSPSAARSPPRHCARRAAAPARAPTCRSSSCTPSWTPPCAHWTRRSRARSAWTSARHRSSPSSCSWCGWRRAAALKVTPKMGPE
ncbi:vacuolar protein sorting-associated protein 26C isoform X5 [Bicyclus anynana]|uniref:Vacuolar protein sorting-associated protein 26C isoform X5 n=1 Tax=Bicyclus anynana TaxID=110368 RepID=A0ABM3M0K0_BICAN|nr:vacuolar protein sorting-associated protein 26C isoform X5 [Bicyclus anynana]